MRLVIATLFAVTSVLAAVGYVAVGAMGGPEAIPDIIAVVSR